MTAIYNYRALYLPVVFLSLFTVMILSALSFEILIHVLAVIWFDYLITIFLSSVLDLGFSLCLCLFWSGFCLCTGLFLSMCLLAVVTSGSGPVCVMSCVRFAYYLMYVTWLCSTLPVCSCVNGCQFTSLAFWSSWYVECSACLCCWIYQLGLDLVLLNGLHPFLAMLPCKPHYSAFC